MFTKSFQTRIEEANKVFVSALEKLKSIQSDIATRITDNNSQIQQLTAENGSLDSMKAKTGKQISEIEKLIG